MVAKRNAEQTQAAHLFFCLLSQTLKNKYRFHEVFKKGMTGAHWDELFIIAF
jgi:hypothetical protein